MSAQSLGEKYPKNYKTLKVIAQERWKHIEIEERNFKRDINGMRMMIGDSKTYWLISINDDLSCEEKYKTLVHELMHCTIDEIKMLETGTEDEKLITYIESNLME